MAAELNLAPEVEWDVLEAYAWYEGRHPGLGEEFLTCVDACIQVICRHPEMYAKVMRIIAERWSGAFLTRCSTSIQKTK